MRKKIAGKKVPGGSLILIIGLAVAIIFLQSWRNATEKPSIEDTLTAAIHVSMQAGVISANAALATDLTEIQRTTLLWDYTELLKRYYTEDSGAVEIFSAEKEAVLYSDATIVNRAIEQGIAETTLHSLDSEKNTAVADVSIVGWIKKIKEEDGIFTIYIPINKNRIAMGLVKEDGNWKVSYYSVLGTDSVPESYREKQGSYDSYAEAYAAALEIEVTNPF